jgi:hypothetical protein
VVVTLRGHQLVAIVPLEDLLWLEDLEDKEDLRAYRAAMREAKRKGTVPWERLKKELGLE